MFELPVIPKLHLPSFRWIISSSAQIGIWTGVLGVSYCVLLLFTQTSVENTAPPATTLEQSCLTQQPVGEVVVYVSGAVQSPGLYTLLPGQRIAEAVTLAGGTTDQADTYHIATQINLAAEAVDGSTIHIPRVDATAITHSSIEGRQVVAGEGTTTKVSINTASTAELESLPRIGEKTASTIIANRPYSSIDELVTKAGLSNSILSELINELSL